MHPTEYESYGNVGRPAANWVYNIKVLAFYVTLYRWGIVIMEILLKPGF